MASSLPASSEPTVRALLDQSLDVVLKRSKAKSDHWFKWFRPDYIHPEGAAHLSTFMATAAYNTLIERETAKATRAFRKALPRSELPDFRNLLTNAVTERRDSLVRTTSMGNGEITETMRSILSNALSRTLPKEKLCGRDVYSTENLMVLRNVIETLPTALQMEEIEDPRIVACITDCVAFARESLATTIGREVSPTDLKGIYVKQKLKEIYDNLETNRAFLDHMVTALNHLIRVNMNYRAEAFIKDAIRHHIPEIKTPEGAQQVLSLITPLRSHATLRHPLYLHTEHEHIPSFEIVETIRAEIARIKSERDELSYEAQCYIEALNFIILKVKPRLVNGYIRQVAEERAKSFRPSRDFSADAPAVSVPFADACADMGRVASRKDNAATEFINRVFTTAAEKLQQYEQLQKQIKTRQTENSSIQREITLLTGAQDGLRATLMHLKIPATHESSDEMRKALLEHSASITAEIETHERNIEQLQSAIKTKESEIETFRTRLGAIWEDYQATLRQAQETTTESYHRYVAEKRFEQITGIELKTTPSERRLDCIKMTIADLEVQTTNIWQRHLPGQWALEMKDIERLSKAKALALAPEARTASELQALAAVRGAYDRALAAQQNLRRLDQMTVRLHQLRAYQKMFVEGRDPFRKTPSFSYRFEDQTISKETIEQAKQKWAAIIDKRPPENRFAALRILSDMLGRGKLSTDEGIVIRQHIMR